MAKFLIRVEMHQASSTQYDQLHAAMEKAGAHRLIMSSDGRAYRLPTAEYVYVAIAKIEEVRNNVLAIARGIWGTPDPWVLVVDYNSAAWSTKPV